MNYLIPAVVVFLLEVYLLFSWLKSRRNEDGRERKLCFLGFLLGQIYLLWEVMLVKQTGQPAPGSPEQKLLMGRILLGVGMGGLFTIIGLFYLSFGAFPKRQ